MSNATRHITSRNLRKLLPHIWRRRWLLILTFGIMCVYSATLQLRNLVPGVFFDGVLVPGLGGKSMMPQSFRRILAPIGINPSEHEQPVVLSGGFRDLVLEDYRNVEATEEGRYTFHDGTARFRLVVGDDAVPQGSPVKFTRLSIACDETAVARGPEDRIASIREGSSLRLELTPPVDMTRKGHLLQVLVVFGLAVCLLIFATRFASKFLEQYVLQHVLAGIRQDLIDHMSSLSLSFYNNRSRGDLLSRLSNDLNRVSTTLQLIFGDILLQPLVLLFSAATCLYINWWLALIVFLAFPFLFVLMARAGKKVRRRSHKQSAKRGLMTTAVEQLFSGIRTVKSFNMEKFEREHFDEKNAAVVKESMRTAKAKIFANTTVEFVAHAGVIVVLAIGGFFLVRGELGLTIGELVVFIACVNTMYMPVKVLAKSYTAFQDSMGAMDRVMEIFDSRPTIIEVPGASALPPFRQSILFDGVSFSYGREPVLQDLDLEIRAGTLTAIVGPTGAGKSTIVDLLLRFYDPTEGRILIDGRDIRSVTIDSLTAQISIVSQDPFLFDTTIANNIHYGRPGASRDEIEEAARMANIHDFIVSLPSGYDTPIGDRGVMLSGGQRQRITIARSLLKDAPILILDEATSNLDSESESAVQDALEKLIKVRSTIAIAHRLSTIVKADQIVVVDCGRIVETGRHRDLIERRGLFYRLYSRQQGNGDGFLGSESPASGAGTTAPSAG